MPAASSPTSLTRPKVVMTVRVEAETLVAFDAMAEGRGGRSALFRALVDHQVEGFKTAPLIAARKETAAGRLSIRLTSPELAVLDDRAAERGTDRAGWVKALVRRHLGLKIGADDGLRKAVTPIRIQLQRIGRNLNQAMKAGNAAMMADSGLQIDRELARIADMRDDINEQIAVLGEALRSDLSFWKVAD